MKPETARGLRRSVPRRRRAHTRPDSGGTSATNATGWSSGVGHPYGMPDAGSHDPDSTDVFDPAEFAEFLEADDAPIPADLAFKERLRQRLWGMVRDAGQPTSAPVSRIGERPRRPTPDPDRKRPR